MVKHLGRRTRDVKATIYVTIGIAHDPLPTTESSYAASSVFSCRHSAGGSIEAGQPQANQCSATRLSMIWAEDLGGNRTATATGAYYPAFGTGDASHPMPIICAATSPPERSTPAYLLTAACHAACSTAVLPMVLPGVHELGADPASCCLAGLSLMHRLHHERRLRPDLTV